MDSRRKPSRKTSKSWSQDTDGAGVCAHGRGFCRRAYGVHGFGNEKLDWNSVP
jgi:hypothetical protein